MFKDLALSRRGPSKLVLGLSTCDDDVLANARVVHAGTDNDAADAIAQVVNDLQSVGDTYALDTHMQAFDILDNRQRYTYRQKLGAGAYGKVFEYMSTNGKGSVAVKVSTRASQSRPLAEWTDTMTEFMANSDEETCAIVRTVVLLDGQVQVMQLGRGRPAIMSSKTHSTATFAKFCNKAARCFLSSGLSCTDWKLDNLTYFTGDEWNCSSGYRVIDVDSIEITGSTAARCVATFSCGYIPLAAYDGDPKTSAMQMITTAYNIELGKAFFRYNLSRFGFDGFFASIGARKHFVNADGNMEETEDYRATVTSTLAQLTTLGAVEPDEDRTTFEYRQVVTARPVALLRAVEKLTTFLNDKETAEQACEYIRQLLLTWFSFDNDENDNVDRRAQDMPPNATALPDKDYFFTPATSRRAPKFGFLRR